MTRAQLRRGEALADLPVAAAAGARGDIGAAHLDTLVRVKSPVTEEALARDEGLLVDDARTMKFAPFCSAVAYWEHLADQDGTEEAALERAARRDVYLVPSVHGTYLGKINLDPLGGATVANELERLYDELYEADWDRAKDELGRFCQHEYCDEPAARCQIDHIVPYGEGGPTSQENGRVLCAFHNRLRAQRPPPGD